MKEQRDKQRDILELLGEYQPNSPTLGSSGNKPEIPISRGVMFKHNSLVGVGCNRELIEFGEEFDTDRDYPF